jgi:peroxiredoxin
MLQTEIAGRTIPSPDGYPSKGYVFRDFQLCSSEGLPVLLSDYRRQSSMVLVFTGESDFVAALLSELNVHESELAESETRVLVIIPGTQQRAAALKDSLHLQFTVLVDVDGRVHRSAGTEDHARCALPALFITDQFGEVFAAYRVGQGENLPVIAEIQSWLELISRQCPECGSPEWPD